VAKALEAQFGQPKSVKIIWKPQNTIDVDEDKAATLMKLNQKGVPTVAVLINFLVGLFMFIPLPDWQRLVSFQSAAIVLAYGTGPISLLALRCQAPELKRPFKLPCVYLLSGISFYVCNLIAYWSGWDMIWRLMLSLIFGMALFLAYRYKQRTPIELNLRSSLWLLPNFAGLSLISYLGNFGGGLGIISFGWDFVIIAVFSVLIIWIAHKLRLPDNMAKDQLAQE